MGLCNLSSQLIWMAFLVGSSAIQLMKRIEFRLEGGSQKGNFF